MNDNVTPDDWEAQLIDYTLGVMAPQDAAAFEESLEECRRHVVLARDYVAVAGLLGAAVPPAEPPEGHKSRLLTRVHATPQAAGSSPLAAQAQATAPVSISTVRPVPPRVSEPAAEVAPAATQEQGKVTGLAEYRSRSNGNGLLAALASVAAVVALLLGIWAWTATNSVNIPSGYTAINLPAQPGHEGLTALALYNPQKNDVVLVAKGLPQLPSDKLYEFWFLKAKGNPDPAGTFTPDQAGSAAHSAMAGQTMAQYAGFAVSIEQKPGGQAPQGPVILAGTYASP